MITTAPLWLIISLTVVLPFILIAALAVRAYFISRSTFRTMFGTNVYVDKSITASLSRYDLDFILNTFANSMSPTPYKIEELTKHIGEMSIRLKGEKLKTDRSPMTRKARAEGKPIPTYEGITWGTHQIEIACDKDYVHDGKLQLHKTALIYELHNACMLKFTGNHAMALAEVFIDPKDEAWWDSFTDTDGDGDVDAMDVRKLKKQREEYDAHYRRAVKNIISELERPLNGDFS